MAGCVQLRPDVDIGIGDYGSPWYVCDGLTANQIKIIQLLRKRFPTLKISAPYPLIEDHHRSSSSLDFVSPKTDSGEMPVLFQAFELLIKENWPGGLGIGIGEAQRHLHVDLANRKAYWFELDQKKPPTQILYGESLWPIWYQTAKLDYGWDPRKPVAPAPEIYGVSPWEDLKKAAWIAGGIATAVFFRDEIREIVRKAIK